MWLPSKGLNGPSIRCVNEARCGKELDDGGHNHPVVVLKVRQKKGSSIVGDLICTIACITTFSDTSLSKYSTMRRHKEASIPIYDPETIPLTSGKGLALIQLKLEKGRLKKQSYVRLQHTYRVPVSMLRQYAYRKGRAYKRRLSDVSYNTLMRLLALSPEKYEKTADLIETKDQRLLEQAGSGFPPIIQTKRVQRPAQSTRGAPQSLPYTLYGAINTNPPMSHYVPPNHAYHARNDTRSVYESQDDGGDKSSYPFKLIIGMIIIGLGWWHWRSKSA